MKCEDNRVMHVHDRTVKPVESSTNTQTVQEFGSPEYRDTASSNANKFNLAIDEENIDFNISGVPNAMVKRSHGVNVHNLIQKIENHPQRRSLQSDLQQHRAFNHFSKKTKDAITAAGNTELCEIVVVEPKSQCRACLTYWDVGIVYCTCGHFLRDDTTENKKYIASVLDLFSIPNFYIRKGRPHGHRYGKKGCKEFHTAKQLQKRCRKEQYENIHDRFIRDTWFRKTMIELGRSEEVILEMDRLASEDQSHIAKEEIDVYRGNWWIRSNLVDSDTMPMRHRPDFKKALSTLHRLKKTEDKAHYENWSKSSSSWWQWQTSWWHPYLRPHHDDGLDTYRTGKPATISESSIYLWHESHKEFGAQFTVVFSVTVNAVHCHRRVCNEYIYSYRKSQQKRLCELYNIYTNFIKTNEDNNHDTKYTNKNDTNNHDARDLHE